MFEIILKPIDEFLNRITMYRLMLYYLFFLIGCAAILSLFELMPFSFVELMLSTLFLILFCWIFNKLFSWIFRIPANAESVYITALILSLIIIHTSDKGGLAFLLFASFTAMASKYLLAFRGKHIFNPAALAVLVTFYTISQGAAWWVGNQYLLIPVLVGGLLIVRKIQRFDLVLSFLAAELGTLVINNWNNDPGLLFKSTLINSSLLFFAFVMLVEPLTSPVTRKMRILYGLALGFLYATSFSIGQYIFSSPELVLVLGNVFIFIISPKGRLRLRLKSQKVVADGIRSYLFEMNRPIKFKAGQYLEWTLGHQNSDTRGNRRYFTIASSPTEREIMLGVKFYDPSSTFKKKLMELNPGDEIFAGQLSGEFVLPKDQSQKLVFIAGGIGITPFRSMIKYLVDKNEKREITIFYSNKNDGEVAYKDVLEEAEQKLGIKVKYIFTESTGRLSADTIKKEVADISISKFMISGSRNMVKSFEKELKSLGVPNRNIMTDFFPGYV